MRTATPNYSKLVYTAPTSGKSTSLWSTLVGFIIRLQAVARSGPRRLRWRSRESTIHAIVTSHRGIAAPLIGCIGLILSPHSRLRERCRYAISLLVGVQPKRLPKVNLNFANLTCLKRTC
jgi:hypothetical protein